MQTSDVDAIERLNDETTRTGSCHGLRAWTLERQLYRPQNDGLSTFTDNSKTLGECNTTRHVPRG